MRLDPQELRRTCDPATLPFATTAELPELPGPVGQSRAVEALSLALAVRREGYHVYALGRPGSGRHSLVRGYLEGRAAADPPPSDWCYVFNFADSYRPRALALPAGRAKAFQAAMSRLVEDLRAGLPAAFETDRYRAQVRGLEAALEARQERAFADVLARAAADQVAVERSEEQLTVAPMAGGKVLDEEAFVRLPPAEQQRLNRLVDRHSRKLESLLDHVPRWRREAQHKLRALHRKLARSVGASLMREVRRQFPEVRGYLAEVLEELVAHADDFRPAEEGSELGLPETDSAALESRLKRFRVNVLIDHSPSPEAPIITADHPTHGNLVGRIEHVLEQGGLATDFTLIKPGALHRANGGYLIVQADKLLAAPPAWDTLKRALRSHEVVVEPAEEEQLAATLQPEPIPLDLKVIVVGGRELYEALHHADADFRELFKILAEFEIDMPRTPASELEYSRLLGTLARRDGLKPLTGGAVARLLEHSARLAEDAHKLWLPMRTLLDLLIESDHFASGPAVEARDVEEALRAQAHRSGSARERLLEEVDRRLQFIDTEGARVGQVNALSVLEQGGYRFGHPLRVSARVGVGRGEMVDVERETDLGGPLHSKGFLILAGYLAGRYCCDRLPSLFASLVFEQCYAESEGDSASSAELYSLLSALAETPLRQDLAVTGSVSQWGEIQPVGGVNEKIEGFFAVCRRRGLTGTQGVLVPASNAQHLMLEPEVVEAVRAGQFHVYAVATVDAGLELLTGLASAACHARVERRLARFAWRARRDDPDLPSKRRHRLI